MNLYGWKFKPGIVYYSITVEYCKMTRNQTLDSWAAQVTLLFPKTKQKIVIHQFTELYIHGHPRSRDTNKNASWNG